MALIRDKKLLALALEWKANPKHANESEFRYKGINYDFEKEIFPSARLQFQKYDKAYKDNKTFAEAFARDLYKKNSELIAEINKGAKTPEEQIYYEEQPPAQAEGVPPQQTPVGESPDSMSGGMPFPGLSSGGMAPRAARRIIYVTPQPETPQPKIVIANKSGVVTEAGDASKLVKATRSGEIIEPPPSKIHVADKSGAVVGERNITPSSTSPAGQEIKTPKLAIANKSGIVTEAGGPSKLVTANSSGALKGLGGETPTRQIFTANKSGVVTGMHNIKPPGWLKTFGSNAQIFLKKNLVNGLAGLAGGLGGGLAFGGNPLGILGGGIGGVAGKSWLGNGGFAKIGNGIVDRASRFSNLASGRISTTGKLAQSRAKWAIVALIGFIFFSAAISAFLPSGQTPTAGATPLNPSPIVSGLDYIIAYRDSSVIATDPDEVKKQVLARWPNAHLENWDTIVSESIRNNWNPAFVLALWIEETGAQGEPSYTDPLGCAPLQPTTDINVSLSCLFNNFSNYTNDQFAQFMAKYSGGPTGSPFSNNPNFPANIKIWYSRLVPSGPGAPQTVTITSSQPNGCPVHGIVTNPYGYNINGYPFSNEDCQSLRSCHNGIDLGASVYTEVKSTIDGAVKNKGTDSFKGNFIEISNTSGFAITYEHLNELPSLNLGDNVQKGNIVGKVGSGGEGVTGPHLHYKIKKDGVLINPLRYVGQLQYPAFTPFASSDDISANDYSGAQIGTTNNFGFCGSQP